MSQDNEELIKCLTEKEINYESRQRRINQMFK